MNITSPAEISKMSGGTIRPDSASTNVSRVITDSRSVKAGDLFIALRGTQFDGHTFVEDVTRQGASAVMVDREVSSDATLIHVKDTLVGLQTLAKNYRDTLDCHIVAITGSNGKTSTKDFTSAVFSADRSVSKTQGNLNNHIGLPLSVLAINATHEVAILEMGMNHSGEIALLAAIAKPHTAIITNIGTAHIEFLKTQEAIAEEKASLAYTVSKDGVVILNANDAFTPAIAKGCRAKVITAGIDSGDVCATNLVTDSNGTAFRISYGSETAMAFVPVIGRHMVSNAVLALAAGLSKGIPLRTAIDGLAKVQPTGGRLESKEIGGIHFLDDTYNANPDSMLAALHALSEMKVSGKRVAVLGAMGELGVYSEQGHRRVGAAAESLDLLMTIGETADWIADEAEKSGFVQVIRTADAAQAAAALLSILQPGDYVLVKGSRSARMETVIQNLSDCLQPLTTTV